MKVKARYNHGIPIKKAKSKEVIGRVFAINTKLSRRQTCNGTSEFIESVVIDFAFDNGCTASQTFYCGDVYPTDLGEKMRGFLILNQWGSYDFVGTHLLETK